MGRSSKDTMESPYSARLPSSLSWRQNREDTSSSGNGRWAAPFFTAPLGPAFAGHGVVVTVSARPSPSARSSVAPTGVVAPLGGSPDSLRHPVSGLHIDGPATLNCNRRSPGMELLSQSRLVPRRVPAPPSLRLVLSLRSGVARIRYAHPVSGLHIDGPATLNCNRRSPGMELLSQSRLVPRPSARSVFSAPLGPVFAGHGVHTAAPARPSPSARSSVAPTPRFRSAEATLLRQLHRNPQSAQSAAKA